MLLFSYWVTNQHFLLSGSEMGLMRYVELIKGTFYPQTRNNVPDSVMLINVSNDPTLIVTGSRDKKAIPKGYDLITDRKKLLQLLEELKRRNDYKYILLDVYFSDSEDDQTDADSALFNTIISMERIIIPRFYEEKLADERLNQKAGYVNYYTNFEFDSFSKFPYLIDDQQSLPLKMYEDLTGNHVDTHGIIPTENSWPIRQSILLSFDIRLDIESTDREEGDTVWWNLGKDLLRCTFNDSIKGNEELYNPNMSTNGKYIVIGAFSGNNDKHYTYIGNQPGAIILFNAFLVLMRQGHHIHILVFLVMLLVFWWMSYYILGEEKNAEKKIEEEKIEEEKVEGEKDEGEKKEWKEKAREMAIKLLSSTAKYANYTANFIASYAKYSFVLSLLAIITYIWMGVVYDIFITALFFKFLRWIISLCRNKKQTNRLWTFLKNRFSFLSLHG